LICSSSTSSSSSSSSKNMKHITSDHANLRNAVGQHMRGVPCSASAKAVHPLRRVFPRTVCMLAARLPRRVLCCHCSSAGWSPASHRSRTSCCATPCVSAQPACYAMEAASRLPDTQHARLHIVSAHQLLRYALRVFNPSSASVFNTHPELGLHVSAQSVAAMAARLPS
jgi:hypothetical protein